MGAIAAAGSGDVIMVCPGVYVGRLAFTGARSGLSVRSVKPGAAKVRLPAAEGGIIVDVQGVTGLTLKGLAIQTPSGDACAGGNRRGIFISDSTGVVLRNVMVRATGTQTRTGCFLNQAIISAGAGLTILGSTVVDFSSHALTASGGGTLLVDGFTVDYAHAGEHSTGSSGVAATVDVDGAVLRNVTIAGTASGGVTTPRLHGGFDVYSADVWIENATISHLNTAIEVTDATGLVVDGFDVSSAATAVNLFSGSGADISGVVTSSVTTGVTVMFHADATIHGNTLTGASCVDNTSGDKTAGTKNTWTGNTAATSDPTGLCTTPG